MSSTTAPDEVSGLDRTVLRKSLGRVDIVLMTVGAVISIDTIAQIAGVGGAQAFTWAAVIAVTFLFPYALVTAELGSSFREEGGPYMWVKVYGSAGDTLLLIVAILFIFVVLTQASAWMVASDRVQAMAAADGAFFRYFGAFSPRLGTPVRMNMLSGVIATLFTIAATALLQGSSAAVFTVVLTVAVTTLLMSYLIIFPTVIKLRRSMPEVERPFRVPGGNVGLWACLIPIYAWVLLGSWVAVFPGTLERVFGVDYNFVDTWGVSRLTFEFFTVGTLVVLIALAVAGYAWAKNHRAALVEASAGRER